MSLPLLPVLVWFFYLFLWSRGSGCPQVLLRRNCSICSCIFVMSVGGGELRIFLKPSF